MTKNNNSGCFSILYRDTGNKLSRLMSFSLVCILLFSTSAIAQSLTLGVLIQPPYSNSDNNYKKLAEYLSNSIPELDLQIKRLPKQQLITALENQTIDLLLADPIWLINISEQQKHSKVLATVSFNDNEINYSKLGGVIVTSGNNYGVQQLSQLSMASIAYADQSTSGFLAQAKTLEQAAIPLNNNIKLILKNNHLGVIKSVLGQEVDAGFIPSGLIEKYLTDKVLKISDLQVINLNKKTEYPFLLSTELYSGWPLFSITEISPQLLNQLTLVLLSLPKEDPVLLRAGISQFTAAESYFAIDRMMDQFNTGPYAISGETSEFQLSKPDILIIVIMSSLVLITALTGTKLFRRRKHMHHMTRDFNHIKGSYNTILSTIPDLMFELDEKGRFIDLWSGNEHPLNEDRDNLIGNRIHDLMSTESAEEMMLAISVALKKGFSSGQQVKFTNDSNDKWFELSTSLKETPDSNKHVLMLLRDISEQKSQQQQLQKSKKHWQVLAENSSDFILTVDDKFAVTYINKPVVGITPEQVIGLQFSDFVPDFKVLSESVFAQVLDDGKPQQFESHIDIPNANKRRYFINKVQRYYNDKDHRALLITAVDISHHQEAQNKVESNQRLYKSLVDSLPLMIYRVDLDGKITFANQPMSEELNLSDTEIEGKTAYDLYPKDLANKYRLDDLNVINDRKPVKLIEENIDPNSGDKRFVEVIKIPIFDQQKRVAGIQGVYWDVTERMEHEEQLRLSASVFTHAREGIMITELNGIIIQVNDAFTNITGYNKEEVIGRNPNMLRSGVHGKDFYRDMWMDLSQNGYWNGEIWNKNKNGNVYPELLTISAVTDEQGKSKYYLALFSDITMQKEQQKQLEHIAHYDALTGLPNRVLLADRLQQAIAQSHRRNTGLAVGYLDLDGFKEINDTYGHNTGDQLLTILASRMKEALRESDTIGRLGGDEFVVIISDIGEVEESVPMLNRLLSVAAQPIVIDDNHLQVSSSIGVAYYSDQQDLDPDQLLRQADHAMYQAKLAGKNRYTFFDKEKDQGAREHSEILEQIKVAIDENQLVLYYQPKVNMKTGEIFGVEALIRWIHPEKGMIPPNLFLPEIEEHQLDIEIGEWVINSALQQLNQWTKQNIKLSLSINISAHHLQQKDFTQRLRELLQQHNMKRCNRLQLEVLESGAIKDLNKVAKIIRDCSSLGIKFALDDFGTGYSSLTYLKALPAAQLKIDQTFVRDMLEDPEDLAILEGILGMATAFERDVIAEGVETAEHGTVLLQLGCLNAQGYGIAKPMPAEQLTPWMTTWKPFPVWKNTMPVSRENMPLMHAYLDFNAWLNKALDYLSADKDLKPVWQPEELRLSKWFDREKTGRFAENQDFKNAELLLQQLFKLLTLTLKAKQQSYNAPPLDQVEVLRSMNKNLDQHVSNLLYTTLN